MTTYLKAFELCSLDKPVIFRLKGGYVWWETISYRNSDRCVISRIVDQGGKPFFLGLNYIHRYISPDALVEVRTERGGVLEKNQNKVE